MPKISTHRLFFALSAVCLLLLTLFALALSGLSYLRKDKASIQANEVKDYFKFVPNRAYRPKVVFFQTSLNPLSNQIENSLRSVYEILQNRFDYTPHYYFEKTTDLASYCSNLIPSADKCSELISYGRFKDTQECQAQLSSDSANCLNPKNYLSAGENFYTSANGRQEMNQNIREICAYNLASDKLYWWQFVTNVNHNCTVENSDLCWQDQAKKSNLNTTKITECFNQKAISIIEDEIKFISSTQKPIASAIKINDQEFPPTNIPADRKIFVNFQTIEPHLRYTPNALKEAVCDSFVRPPKECRLKLDEEGNRNDN